MAATPWWQARCVLPPAFPRSRNCGPTTSHAIARRSPPNHQSCRMERPMSDTTRYLVLIDGKRGAYGAVFLDLPGCTAMGHTIEETLRNAAEAAGEWVQAIGKPPPQPRSIETLRNDPEVKRALAADSTLAIVPVIFESGRSVKANVSLDAGVLKAIDDAAVSTDSHALPSSPAQHEKKSSVERDRTHRICHRRFEH